MTARSVYCSKCRKSYYPCPETRTDAECCVNACKKVPTNTPGQQRLGGQVKMKYGGAIGPNGVL